MPCVAREEDNYFFALSQYQKPLEEILSQNPRFVQLPYRLNEVQSLMKNGSRDFSISRALVDWGIHVPDDDNQTIYVWFDALLGYISGLTEDSEQQNLETAVSLGWPASLHLIGKMPIKKLYMLTEMAAQGEHGGSAEAIYAGREKLKITHFFDSLQYIVRFTKSLSLL